MTEKRVKASDPEYTELNVLADLIARANNPHLFTGEIDVTEDQIDEIVNSLHLRMDILLQPYVHIRLRKYE